MAGTPAQNKEGKIESDERNLFLTLGCLGRFWKNHPPFLVYNFRTILFFNHHVKTLLSLVFWDCEIYPLGQSPAD